MKQEQIKDFTRRLTQCNKGGMIVIMYDIMFAYIKDAEDAHREDDYEGFKEAVGRAQRVVNELAGALDFQYEVSRELYRLYMFVRETLALAVVKNSAEGLADIREVLMNLYEGFTEAAKQDHSDSLMRNAQQVYAGITYGKNNLTETFQDPETSRGFFA